MIIHASQKEKILWVNQKVSLKIILSKFTLNYDSKEEKESDQSTPEVKVQQVSDSNHLIVYYDNSTVQPNDYNIGLIINDNVIFYRK